MFIPTCSFSVVSLSRRTLFLFILLFPRKGYNLYSVNVFKVLFPVLHKSTFPIEIFNNTMLDCFNFTIILIGQNL